MASTSQPLRKRRFAIHLSEKAPNREFSFLQRLGTLRETIVSLDGSDLKTTFRDSLVYEGPQSRMVVFTCTTGPAGEQWEAHRLRYENAL